ncbi:MAG: glutamine--fructose-6-phosphate transaminase (isomerizing) [Gammaproteobacteria bacterium]
MCGIVGAVAQRNVTPILLEGLHRLEYRGYDSAGVAVINGDAVLDRVRVQGKVKQLQDALNAQPLSGNIGIAHTRWATHGEPSVNNAHPHIGGNEICIVHNGIIENHEALREQQAQQGYEFESDTDTELIANQIHACAAQGKDLLTATKNALTGLRGAYSLAIISSREPDRMVVARQGSPLVIGVGNGEHFAASDIFALLPVTRRFIILQEGDMADITRQAVKIYDRDGKQVERAVTDSAMPADAAEKAGYRHYMLKEIHAQPGAVADTLQACIDQGHLLASCFGEQAESLFPQIEAVHITACGSSYHAGLVARYWFEDLSGIPCTVDIASEYRYRNTVVRPNTLFVSLSQSGETLDTLEALRVAASRGYKASLAICNVAESSLTRESDMVFLTRAGREIGVASTKAFTTQLVSLLLLVLLLARRSGLTAEQEARFTAELDKLPGIINSVFTLEGQIAALAEEFVQKQHVLYLGRGTMLPVAMEGALKLKEISYTHAEAYPAGELKHGPLALVDEGMPVIAVAPNDALIEKLKSNLHEVKARGGKLYLYIEQGLSLQDDDNISLIPLPKVDAYLAPIVYTVPLQMFAYHVAVLKGLDVDQPRNLAKSVTVE